MPQLNKNLLVAKETVAYVKDEIGIRASNRPADLERAETRYKTGIDPILKLTPRSVDEQRNAWYGGREIILNLSTVLAEADKTEQTRIGNCGEQVMSAIKYLYGRKDVHQFSHVNAEGAHDLIFINVPREKLKGMFSLNAPPPDWPKDAAICDPWTEKWFGLDEWSQEMPKILQEALPGLDRSEQPKVDLEPVLSVVRGEALPFPKALIKGETDSLTKITGPDPKIYYLSDEEYKAKEMAIIETAVCFIDHFHDVEILSTLTEPQIESHIAQAESLKSELEDHLYEINGRYYETFLEEIVRKYPGITGNELSPDLDPDQFNELIGQSPYIIDLEKPLLANAYIRLKCQQLQSLAKERLNFLQTAPSSQEAAKSGSATLEAFRKSEKPPTAYHRKQ